MKARLLQRWEALSSPVQLVTALIVGFVFMFLIHIGPFRQPLGRALGYGVFWGVLMGGGIVVATRTEQAKRRQAERRKDDQQ